MDSSFEGLGSALVTASVKLSNAWLIEFIRQNYLYIIMFLAVLFFIWLIGLMIKNWIWKIDKISDSLEKIAISLDFLATKVDQQNGDVVFIEKSVNEEKK